MERCRHWGQVLMIYWRILTTYGTTGYQVMDGNLEGAVLFDDAGAPLTGSFGYEVTDTNPTLPGWANA
jgi:hypothetical protein